MKKHKLVKKLVDQSLFNLKEFLKTQVKNRGEWLVLQKIFKKNSYIVWLLLQSFFLMVRIKPVTEDILQLSKKIAENMVLNMIRFLLSSINNGKKADFWKQRLQKITFETWETNQLHFAIQNMLLQTKWGENGIKIAKMLGRAFGEFNIKAFQTSEKQISIFQKLGFYIGCVMLIKDLERKLHKYFFHFLLNKRTRLLNKREKLFFLKLNFVENYIENLKKSYKYEYNFYIKNINWILN